MCDIEDVVSKITPVFNILNPFCPRLSGDHFAQEHKTRVCEFCKYKKGKCISRRHVIMVFD